MGSGTLKPQEQVRSPQRVRGGRRAESRAQGTPSRQWAGKMTEGRGSQEGRGQTETGHHNARDPRSIPRPGRSPGGGNGNPLQCACLENPVDRGAWQPTVHEVSKSQSNTQERQQSGARGVGRQEEVVLAPGEAGRPSRKAGPTRACLKAQGRSLQKGWV